MKYRNIIEMSCMSNNDERIMYTDEELPWDVKIKGGGFMEHPKLVISRPVFPEEIEAGLNTSWEGSVWDDNMPKMPDLTLALDDFYKLKRDIDFGRNFLGRDLQSTINNAIAYSFYDCMSGGAGVYFLSACRWFIEHYSLDLNDEVYPASESRPGSGPRGWYTLGDFLEEIKNIPRIEEMIEKLPAVAKLLPSG